MISSTMIKELSGPFKGVRSARLKILLEESIVKTEVIDTLLLVDSIPASITEYRDRERHLENLLKELQQDGPASCEYTQTAAYSYLLGSLYINFEKFWGPTVRVINDILNQTKFQTKLLDILLAHLIETNDLIYSAEKLEDVDNDRPDHVLHRNFLFQLMTKFPLFVESHDQVFMEQFFRFVQKELLVSPFIEKFTRDDLSVNKSSSTTEEELAKEDTKDVGKGRGMRKGKESIDSGIILQKNKSKETFITAIKVIQKFENINRVHCQQELKNLLYDLLCCRDTAIQKASFNCLIAYDEDYLKPYIDKILKLLNDKMVRTEMTLFSIDAEETDQVQEKHRSKLMPILLRIIFGKMIGKIGKKSAGRDKADLRKTLVMRFIAGCTFDEIKYFFSLLFEPIFQYAEVPYDELEGTLAKDIDLKNYVPLNKLQAMLSSLATFMESVAHLKEESLAYVLKLINIIIYHVVEPLKNQELLSLINSKNVATLRTLKRGCMNIVSDYFRMFEYYNFQQKEINFIFNYLVWTSTSGFIDKNHASPTPFMKLIESFASNRVYHPLLVKRNSNNREEFLLRHIIELYSYSKLNRSVNKFIATLIADILDPHRKSSGESEEEDDDEEIKGKILELPILEVEDCVIPNYDENFYKITRKLTFNEEILISSIPVIFERLKRNFSEFVNKKDAENRVESNELIVLSRLSEFLKDSDQSLLAIKLLLTTLDYQKRADLIMQTLKTIQVLVKQVKSISDTGVIPLLGGILSYQRNISQRKELSTILELLSNIDESLMTASRAINLMNCTSDELLDNPDLVKWNEGFQISFGYIDNLNEVTINQPEFVKNSIMLLICQTGFIMNNIDRFEFSIRENCLIFYEKLAMKLNLVDHELNQEILREIIEEVLLDKFIKKGLRNTNESIKHIFIGILRPLALHCHEKNKTLSEFNLVCNDNQDLDFWLNIRHIQLHNRSRALSRLISGGDIAKMTPKTLSSYFMPIAAGFLFSKAYKTVSSLIDNSIMLIGMICKQLNWKTYEATLGYYLDLLTKAKSTYQRTNIKLITEIIKNFNYDITACKEAMQNEEENKKLEKRMKRRRGTNEDDSKDVIATDAPSGKRLNPSTAKMVYYSVTKKLIPRLSSCLHEMTRVEFEHDKNMADYLPEKEEIKRVPIAYAIIQLLNLLPGRYVLFRDHLPTLFLKLSSFLKSKNEDVRKAARATLVKIMTFVGPAYMPDLLRILKQNLEKGFQIHVLNYTIHSVLEKAPLKYASLDHSVHELTNSCFQEIFGQLSEDKEIAQILAKTYEAKKTKSYDTLFILSSYISADKLEYLMNSLKEVLKTSNDPKKVSKLSQCIQKVFVGLAKNDGFPLEKLLDFTRTTIEEYIPNLRVREKVEEVEKRDTKFQESKSKASLREDRYLIEKELGRNRIKSKINEKGNSHMIVENCLRLLLNTFEKNESLIKRKETHKKKLDCFITLLSTCLKSSSPRCVTRSLKCIYFIARTKPDLPTFKTKCNSIVKKIFILLSLYNGVGMVQGDNFEMIGTCFKTLSLLLLRCEHIKLNDTQVRVLLTYIEQDLCDTTRQATAFETLQSLLQKKCNSPELLAIMNKIAELLVTSEDDKVRALSIKIWQIYLLEYKHEGGLLQVYMKQFLRQLDYEFIDGRRSVLKMLTAIVTKFPENLLRDYHELMFHLLAQRVVNEESKELRGIVSRLIGLLNQRLPDQQVCFLNQYIFKWASEESPGLKLLGIKLTSIFVESCTSLFKSDRSRVERILTIISSSLENVTKNNHSSTKENEPDIDNGIKDMSMISVNDNLSYHTLRLFKRLLDKDLIKPIETRFIKKLKKIWQNIASSTLTNKHLPVVLVSCELYLEFIQTTDLGEALKVEDPSPDNYLEWNGKRIVRTLCDKFIDLLDRAEESKELLEHITKGMIILGRYVAGSNSTLEFENNYINSFEGGNIIEYFNQVKELPSDGFVPEKLPYQLVESRKKVDLAWLSIKIVMQAKKEAALYRLSKYYRRDFVLCWSAAIAQELGARRSIPYVFLFSMTPVRELTDKGRGKLDENSIHLNTVAMAEDLLKFMKGLLGLETFNKIYSRLQLHYTRKRVERKKKVAISKVVDQSRGVKRKMTQSKNKVVKRKNSRITKRKAIEDRNYVNKKIRSS